MASTDTSQSPQDPAPWRLVFRLVDIAFEGGRERFIRVLIILIIAAAMIGGLVIVLGPYPATGIGAGSLAAKTLARQGRARRSSRR